MELLHRRNNQSSKIKQEDDTALNEELLEDNQPTTEVPSVVQRSLFSQLEMLNGNSLQLLINQSSSNSYFFTRIIFVHLMGLIYIFSFLAAFNHAPVLIGHKGLYPAYLHIQNMYKNYGSEAPWISPSFFYFLPMESSDIALKTVCAIGTVLGMFMLFTGRCNSIILFLLWCLHMSLYNIGQLFYGFGWESQILETTFLGMFLVPFYSLKRINKHSPPSILFVFLMRFLIFRIMMGAGLIKIRGDQCWRDLTCLNYHYETQPIPNPISYYLHQTPYAFHKFEVIINHITELATPAFVFGLFGFTRHSRLVRHIGGTIQIVFQILLIISGNLSVLNYVTIAPALWCYDDKFCLWKYIFNTKQHKIVKEIKTLNKRLYLMKLIRSIVHLCVFGLIAYLSIKPIANLFSRYQRMNSSFDRLNLVNTYGAFGSVGKIRDEVIISGCDRTNVDECNTHNLWKEYEFICKPGNISRRPCFTAPYHQRLDWQMWFAGFQDIQNNPWLIHLMIQMLASDKKSAINAILATKGNPFLDSPPIFIKADLYRYKFTRLGTGDKNWWARKYMRQYCPILKLDSANVKSIMRQMKWKIPVYPIR
ncbi:unnamed protein product [Didymodactylos carnosus]|uniref:Lipase maturation factor n=1 Tax=Didymodactylos carnosus TaxID=1234261 RepID=A0A814AUC4_9BILA|nr:unnamed protein product [Didymodactylos carnosus]CAF0917151.1 unnamed protein product [Didymodactylos carnosus]CAF3660244.1 unnamed protein product [Didymodactylos carnosus]CAF3697126.1 unnamed protein product [Didymodactylos carnosus]